MLSRKTDISLKDIEGVLPFQLDSFQQQAIDILLKGSSVVVSAPTGAGKTVIAEAATLAVIARYDNHILARLCTRVCSSGERGLCGCQRSHRLWGKSSLLRPPFKIFLQDMLLAGCCATREFGWLLKQTVPEGQDKAASSAQSMLAIVKSKCRCTDSCMAMRPSRGLGL